MIYRREDRCKHCRHYRDNRICSAFPEGIPEDIWDGDNYHLEPVEGDRGYQWNPKTSLLDVDITEWLDKL